MKVDAHQHFWRYDRKEYPWINERMQVIQRDFLPVDLKNETQTSGVKAVVSVQARQSLEETRWLLDLADQFEYIKGVVGWVPLQSSDVGKHLDRFADYTLLKAIGHVVHDEPDIDFILGKSFNEGIGRLKDFGLVYDLLIFESHLSQTIQFVDRHPTQVFVLDHIAKPRIREGKKQPWASLLARLAERENCFCKLSGMITEADWTKWSTDQLRPYFDTVMDAFGPARVMFGSDWPVCLVAGTYAGWVQTVAGYLQSFSPDEQDAIWAGTASRVYSLSL